MESKSHAIAQFWLNAGVSTAFGGLSVQHGMVLACGTACCSTKLSCVPLHGHGGHVPSQINGQTNSQARNVHIIDCRTIKFAHGDDVTTNKAAMLP